MAVERIWRALFIDCRSVHADYAVRASGRVREEGDVSYAVYDRSRVRDWIIDPGIISEVRVFFARNTIVKLQGARPR